MHPHEPRHSYERCIVCHKPFRVYRSQLLTRRHVLYSAMLMAGVACIQTGAGFGAARRHSGDAGVARGTECRCSGYTEKCSCKEMNMSGDPSPTTSPSN